VRFVASGGKRPSDGFFFRAFFRARRAEREARRLTVQTQSSIDARCVVFDERPK
jgi:hypothetical protein